MDMSTTLQTIEEALVGDGPLSDWCQLHYGQKQSVFLGVNPDDQPDGETYYPLIEIFPDESESGWESEKKIERVYVIGGLNEESFEIKADDQNISQTSILRREAFLLKILNVLKGIDFGAGAYIDRVRAIRAEYDPDLWPYTGVGIEFDITYPLSQGDDVFA